MRTLAQRGTPPTVPVSGAAVAPATAPAVEPIAQAIHRAIHPGKDTPVMVMRIDTIWLATEPLDMRAGIDTALARVVNVFGAAHPHCAYLFANKRANRIKLLVHDGLGIWLAARRLHQGGFVWADPSLGRQLSVSHEQLGALVLGLPWQRIGSAGIISVV